MRITQWSTGRLFNESTGRGQQLVACVWAGRIRPLVLGLPALFLSCFPHLLALPSSYQHRQSPCREWSPLSAPLLPVLELWLEPRGPADQPASTRTGGEQGWACHGRPTQRGLWSPFAGRRRKWAKRRETSAELLDKISERRTIGMYRRTEAKLTCKKRTRCILFYISVLF